MGEKGDIRIGTAERAEALAALAEHHAAGRLDANEYEDRRGRANDAVVRRDLTALFDDLPEPRPSLRPAAPVRRTPVSPGQARLARALVSLSPFIAVAAFFLTRSWLAFLLIPALAVLAKTLED